MELNLMEEIRAIVFIDNNIFFSILFPFRLYFLLIYAILINSQNIDSSPNFLLFNLYISLYPPPSPLSHSLFISLYLPWCQILEYWHLKVTVAIAWCAAVSNGWFTSTSSLPLSSSSSLLALLLLCYHKLQDFIDHYCHVSTSSLAFKEGCGRMKVKETERVLLTTQNWFLLFGCFLHYSAYLYASTAIYTSMGGHVHTRLRSPYTLSIRPTVGQNLVEEFTQGAGNAVCEWVWVSVCVRESVCEER